MIFEPFWATTRRSKAIARASNRSRTVPSLLGSLGITYRPKRTTRSLAAINPLSRVPPRLGTCSSWSRTPRNMPQPAGGGTLNLIKTGSLLMQRSMELATPVTCLPKIATMSSPVTRLSTDGATNGLRGTFPPALRAGKTLRMYRKDHKLGESR